MEEMCACVWREATHIVTSFLCDFFAERHAVGEATDTLALVAVVVPFSVIL